jgi:FKBP-type peptidyl-prolyl cis-trans isomerase FkpA
MSNSTREKRRAARAAKRRKQQITFGLLLLLVVALIIGLNWDKMFVKKIPVGDAGTELITTESGLQYEDLIIGKGDAAKPGDFVSVDYTGWLIDGTKFDSSLDRNQPFEFQLGSGTVIDGWEEGLTGMRVGGKRKLTIPAELGYGDQGAGGVIPPGATLIFEVDLLEIK